jgi:uncharacterized protein
MSAEVAGEVAGRIRDHVRLHSISAVSLLFHGGEPLLAGLDHLQQLVAIFRLCLHSETRLFFGMQTNGTLLTREAIGFLEENRFGVGISVDGPPPVNDRHRISLTGKGTGHETIRGLELLRDSPCFSGILCVIDPTSDPLEVWHFLAAYEPPLIDFLLPHGTWDRKPLGHGSPGSTLHGDWLIRIFDAWFAGDRSHIRIRFFEDIIRNSLGGHGRLESLGLQPATLLVVAANGDYEGVDTLKAVIPGAHQLGMDCRTHSLEDVLKHPKVAFRQSGIAALCRDCQACPYVKTCGGGYVTHRYSSVNGFDNPSVYCGDLYKLIGHIQARIVKEARAHAV